VAILERFGPAGHGMTSIAEDEGRISVGKSAENNLVIDNDPTVSRAHAVLEHVGPAWCIEDVGSTNGTMVNGERIFGRRHLTHGDEIILGRTRLVFYDPNRKGDDTTEPVAPPPDLTRGEKKVLTELCRPILSGGAFRPPASVQEIADALYVGPQAIKQHLGRIYDKYGIAEEPRPQDRRVKLANAAIDTGAVTMRDLQQPHD
jgi:DNA-binding CsgD family transcriptional regulator